MPGSAPAIAFLPSTDLNRSRRFFADRLGLALEETTTFAWGVWTTPGGDQVAWFHDPDGNVLSLTQLAVS